MLKVPYLKVFFIIKYLFVLLLSRTAICHIFPPCNETLCKTVYLTVILGSFLVFLILGVCDLTREWLSRLKHFIKIGKLPIQNSGHKFAFLTDKYFVRLLKKRFGFRHRFIHFTLANANLLYDICDLIEICMILNSKWMDANLPAFPSFY